MAASDVTSSEPAPPAAPTGPAPRRRFERVRGYRRRHPIRFVLLPLLAVAVVAGVVAFWLYSRTYEDTDDAQVDAHISPVGVRIAGTVLAVHVDDNQPVSAGQLLVELDPRDYQVEVDRLEADVARAEADLEAAHPNVPITSVTTRTRVTSATDDVSDVRAAVAAAERNAAVARAQLREAQARDDNARADVRRYQALLAESATTAERYDEKRADARAAVAAVEARLAAVHAADQAVRQQRARLSSALARHREASANAPREIAVQQAGVDARASSLAAARAALERARLDLAYCRIHAPVGGIVGRRAVEIGARVQPGQALLNVVQVDDLWVTANFKETQLDRVRPGQPVDIAIDTFGATLHGSVESMPGASGARFSLLPPENATGNYVKVVQRLPVRIRFDPGQELVRALRPGMSVEPKVWLRTEGTLAAGPPPGR